MTTPTPTDKATLAFRCVDLTAAQSLHLDDLTSTARDISFETFSRHVDWKPLAAQMGYSTDRTSTGMRLENDRAATFHSGKFLGRPVYYMVHSAIEFVFRIQRPEHVIHPPEPWGGMERVTLDPAPVPGPGTMDAPRRRTRP